MLCGHSGCMKISQDVFDKYGNILVLNENHLRCLIKVIKEIPSVQNAVWSH